MRGKAGGLSGNGIFTACALKLFPWPGPPRPEPEGLFYDVRMEMPGEVKLFMLVFPDYKMWGEATYRVCLEGIDYNIQKAAIGVVPLIVAPHLSRKLVHTPRIRAMLQALQHGTMLVIAGHSRGELEYREAVVRKITSDHGGVALDLGLTPLGAAFVWAIVGGAVPGMAFRPGGQMQSGLGPDEAWDTAVAWDMAGEEIKKDWIAREGCVDDMGDACVDMLWEDATYNHSEELWYYDPRNEKHSEAVRGIVFDFFLKALEMCSDQPWNIFPQQRGIIGPMQGNFNSWQKNILKALDPRGAADSALYVGETALDTSGLDPGKVRRMGELARDRMWTGEPG
jgi:hypothetical protein